MPDVDLVVHAQPLGLEYFLIVKSEKAVGSVASVSFPWSGPQLEANPVSGLQAKLASGQTLAVPPALMWDARISPRSDEPVHQDEVQVTTARAADGGTDLVLTPSSAFFREPGLTFPVTIDPNAALNPVYDAFIQNTFSTDQSGSTQLKLGYSDDASEGCGSGCIAQSLLRFQQPTAIENSEISKAELFLYNYHSWSCTDMQWEAWRVSVADTSRTWGNPPDWLARSGLSTATKGGGSGCGAGWVTIPVTSTFQYVADTSTETMAKIGLRASTENHHNSWKKFYSSESDSLRPRVEIFYNHPPNRPWALAIDSCYSACISPAVVSSGTPTIKAAFSDPNGGTMRAEFEVWDEVRQKAWARSGTAVTGIKSGTTRGWKVVPIAGYSKLPDAVYYFRVRACETVDKASVCGEWSSSSAWFKFTVSTAMPTLPTVAGSPYLERSTQTWNGGPGQAGTFTIGPNAAANVLEYVYSLNGGNATTVPAGTAQAQMLTTNQQTVGTNLTGFTAGLSSTITRSTTLSRSSPGSVQVAPKSTAATEAGSEGDTYVALGEDSGGVRLGMQGGKRYWVTGWIYVPSTTGLSTTGSYGEPRGLRITGHARSGTNPYVEYKSSKATVTNQWQQLSMVMSVPTGATEAFIRLYNGFPAGQTTKAVYWDDLSVREVTGTTTVTTITPPVDGVNQLAVQSRSTSGLTSDQRIYEFLVMPAGGRHWLWALDDQSDPAPAQPINDRPLSRSTAGATWTEGGKSGLSAASLDGTGDLATSTSVIDTSGASGFTVAAWVRPTDLTGTAYTAISQDGTQTAMFRLELRTDRVDGNGDGTTDPAWCFSMYPTDSTTAAPVSVCTTDAVVDGDWTHLAGVFDNATDTITLYVNGGDLAGGLQLQTSFAPTPWSAAGKFAVGRGFSGTADNRWVGEIDEVRAVQKPAASVDVFQWSQQ